jgi:hypothetical protein
VSLTDDIAALVNQVNAQQASIAALQAQVAAIPSGGGGSSAGPLGPVVFPQQFDALAGTAGHDSTAAIASAIPAVPPGGSLWIPGTVGGYLVSNGFTLTTPINVIGDGDATFFTGTLPANTDLFRVAVPAGQTLRNFSFKRMKFLVANARSWINVDTTAAANTYLQGLVVEDVFAPVSPLNYAFWANGLATGAGLSQADFNRNKFTVDGSSPNACYMFGNVGDTIRINAGIQTGTAYGMWLAQVGGAGGFSYMGGNCTSLGGLVVQSAIKPVFGGAFEIELSNFDMLKLTTNSGKLSSGAGIYLLGCDGATIGPGQIQALATCSNFNEAVYCGATANVNVDDMRLTSAVGGIGINRSSPSAANAGTKNSFAGFATNVV